MSFARLAAYTALASTTGLAGAADAAVVVIDIVPQSGSSFIIDLSAAAHATSSGFVRGYTFRQVWGDPDYWVSALVDSSRGSARQYVARHVVAAGEMIDGNDAWFTMTVDAYPTANATSYLGFRLHVNGNDDYRYGWIEYVHSGSSITVSRWAYESELNTGLIAGASATPAVPGLGGLAALACGAAGVRRNRHRVA